MFGYIKIPIKLLSEELTKLDLIYKLKILDKENIFKKLKIGKLLMVLSLYLMVVMV